MLSILIAKNQYEINSYHHKIISLHSAQPPPPPSNLKYREFFPNKKVFHARTNFFEQIYGEVILNGKTNDQIIRWSDHAKVREESPDHFVTPKKLSLIMAHAGTNDAYHSSSREILNKLLSFKSLIQERLPGCKVFISTPTLHSDNVKQHLR